MISTKIVVFALAVLFFTTCIKAQSNFSIQLNSGISDVTRSFSGFSGLLQLNYSLNSDLDLYLYSGYSNVGKGYRNHFRHGRIDFVEDRHFSGLIEGDKSLIPIYFGGSFDLFKNDWIRSFANLELGYSYLSFSTYESMSPVYSDKGRVLRYRPDRSTRDKHRVNSFGTGIGLGASHPITSGLDVLLTFKFNTSTNFENLKILSRSTTFTSLLAGIKYKI